MEVRITKFDPALRGGKGEFLAKDWTSVTDIGRFPGLTKGLYLEYEAKYLRTLFSIFEDIGVERLTVSEVEFHRPEFPGYSNQLQDLSFQECEKRAIKSGMVVSIEDFADLFRAAMRTVVWFKITGENGVFVHFGYDYYLYFGADREFSWLPIDGIFVEQFVSPYHEV